VLVVVISLIYMDVLDDMFLEHGVRGPVAFDPSAINPVVLELVMNADTAPDGCQPSDQANPLAL